MSTRSNYEYHGACSCCRNPYEYFVVLYTAPEMLGCRADARGLLPRSTCTRACMQQFVMLVQLVHAVSGYVPTRTVGTTQNILSSSRKLSRLAQRVVNNAASSVTACMLLCHTCRLWLLNAPNAQPRVPMIM